MLAPHAAALDREQACALLARLRDLVRMVDELHRLLDEIGPTGDAERPS